ncbi:nitroreductase/quinone reductase family protein [Saccharopolyspora oryzae]|uniref:Nitroreductase/quinone reductase family protein n=1 Tax=Saccharopolyspora oryzae TaxID=2997343 RepID=A0ABT4USG3_9PSEU|nr:nitroreductase/quinone reductase family protein [Saccharopolyspora oryzae]MDA3624017.1 nitroreductase/quinone reductase family protein [Saccharopolyspora oryzae]
MSERKRRLVNVLHRHLANPVMRRVVGRMPGQALLETTGRKSGLARTTPIGGALTGDTFWLVSDHGKSSNYVRNIEADPRVRLQHNGIWRSGTAVLLPEDDARRRLRELPRLNSTMVRLLGTNLMTVRIDLDPPP